MEDGIDKWAKVFGPKLVSDGFIINAFTNIAYIRFIVTSAIYKDRFTNILKKELVQIVPSYAGWLYGFLNSFNDNNSEKDIKWNEMRNCVETI